MFCCCCYLRYSTITTDVLTSIKKTEDSLLRLKRTRKPAGGQGAQTGTGSSSDSTATMTDDDKIRLQFALDVTDFGKIVRDLFSRFLGILFHFETFPCLNVSSVAALLGWAATPKMDQCTVSVVILVWSQSRQN